METFPRTIPHPTSPCHQASNSRQPASSSSSFTIRTDDRFVITRESDILYTLRVIEKRLLSMHCGLPWWREEGVISKGTRYATIHIFPNTPCSNTRVEATRVAQERCYLCTKRNIPGRFRFCALSAGNNLHAAPNQPTVKEGQDIHARRMA